MIGENDPVDEVQGFLFGKLKWVIQCQGHDKNSELGLCPANAPRSHSSQEFFFPSFFTFSSPGSFPSRTDSNLFVSDNYPENPTIFLCNSLLTLISNLLLKQLGKHFSTLAVCPFFPTGQFTQSWKNSWKSWGSTWLKAPMKWLLSKSGKCRVSLRSDFVLFLLDILCFLL